MKKTNLTIIFLAIFLFVNTAIVRKAKAIWIIPVMSISTVITEVTTIISEIAEILSTVESVASQLQVEEGVRGLAKSYMVDLSTKYQNRSGGAFAGDRLGEFKGVDAVADYLSNTGNKYTAANASASQYLLNSYKGMEELVHVQGEVSSLNALGASWSKDDSLVGVSDKVKAYLESDSTASAVVGVSADVLQVATYLEDNKDVLHTLSDVYLEDMENVVEIARDYLTLKSNVSPSSCLTSKVNTVICEIEKTLDGEEPDVFNGDNTRLTEFQAVAAVANSITSVSSNGCKNLKTKTTGVSALYLSEQDHPTTSDAVVAVDSALDNALSCIQDVITATIDSIPAASASQSYFGTDIVSALNSYGKLSSYNQATYNADLVKLATIAAGIRTLQYDLDKLAMIGDANITTSVSDFFDSFLNSNLVSDMIQAAYNKGSGANLGLQGVGSLNFKTSDLKGVTEITGKLDDIFNGSTGDVKPADVANIAFDYLFDEVDFDAFKGKVYQFNEAKYDYCPNGVCDLTKINSGRQIIVNEMLRNANKHTLAENLTAYAVADDSLEDRMDGLTNMATTAEGEEDALTSLYMAKKEALRSILANGYLEADRLYQEALALSAAVVTTNGSLGL